MEQIESFKVNHLQHPAGIYLSRTDGDIFTYDVRLAEPYRDKILTNAQLHSLEHLLATVLRNGEYKDDVIYSGPMGCQTGFYVILRGIGIEMATKIIVEALGFVASYDGKMPGKSKKECGYYRNLSVAKARAVAKSFLEKLN